MYYAYLNTDCIENATFLSIAITPVPGGSRGEHNYHLGVDRCYRRKLVRRKSWCHTGLKSKGIYDPSRRTIRYGLLFDDFISQRNNSISFNLKEVRNPGKSSGLNQNGIDLRRRPPHLQPP
jgi:hypothetical protein